MKGPVGWKDHVLGLVLCVLYVALLVATSGEIGMSRDEGFYVIAAQDYATWFEALAEDPGAAITQEVIDPAWDYNHEHPGLIKSLFALSWLAQKHWGLFSTDALAFRFVGMLSAGLLLWLIYIFGARIFGRLAGLFGAFAYALMPRPFYHAHLDCFDVPITLAITAVIYCYWRALSSRRWLVMLGITFGLSLATKHNTWVLPGIFLIHFVWMRFEQRKKSDVVDASEQKSSEEEQQDALVLPEGGLSEGAASGSASENQLGKDVSDESETRISVSATSPLPLDSYAPQRSQVFQKPWWLLSILLFGPPIFVLTWPWIWNQTFERIAWYVNFHTAHDYYNIAYFGQTHFEPPFPIHYPFVMTFFTVSAVVLAMAIFALVLRLPVMLPSPLRQRFFPNTILRPDTRSTDVLLVGALLAPMVVIALPTSPIFGGTKHWMPSYPFMALYAGLGFRVLSNVLWDQAQVRLGLTQRFSPVLTAALFVVLLAPSAQATAHSHPFGLSHYTYAAGGVPGAADLGMNRQFWGFTTRSLADFFIEEMPDGGTVWLCDMVPTAFNMMHRDGILPDNIRPAWRMDTADFVLVHHELHFAEVDAQAWVTFGSPEVAYVLTYDGVPIISVYENPRRRR